MYLIFFVNYYFHFISLNLDFCQQLLELFPQTLLCSAAVALGFFLINARGKKFLLNLHTNVVTSAMFGSFNIYASIYAIYSSAFLFS